MTSVRYEFEAAVRDGTTWVPLPVTNITPSANIDRIPFADATVTCGAVTGHVWALLDPRTLDPTQGGQVRWRMKQLTPDGIVLGHLPRVGDTTGDWATMYVRTVSRTAGVTTITLSGGETILDDRLVIENTGRLASGYEVSQQLGGAKNFGELLDRLLHITFGHANATGVGDVASEALALPWGPLLTAPSFTLDLPVPVGTPLLQIIETQLSSVGCRLYDAWGLGWFVYDRDHAPTYDAAPELYRWATHDDDLPADVSPIVTGLTETITRGGDWADTVLVTGVSGPLDAQTSWRHFAAGGHGSRGRVIEMESAEPSGNLAASIASRAFRRGQDLTITAQIRLDVIPGARVEIHTRSDVHEAEIVSVEWRPETGDMTVEARSATTMPIEHDTRATAESPTVQSAIKTAEALSAAAYTDAVARIPYEAGQTIAAALQGRKR
ncbi:hypothetical protein [Microbacterium aurum]|uniref:hypothetical protein n=1 Tax=Microbacterium aurum TaxID=36805 RepID=UPI0028E48445|nr:hypothetical protein [Microbacterium aurum]